MSDKLFGINLNCDKTNFVENYTEFLNTKFLYLLTPLIWDLENEIYNINDIEMSKNDLFNNWQEKVCINKNVSEICNIEDLNDFEYNQRIFIDHFSYCEYLGVKMIYLSGPSESFSINFIQTILSALDFFNGTICLELGGLESSWWNCWNKIRTYCRYHPRLVLSLVIPIDLPDFCEIQRWFGEPIKYIILRPEVFITHDSGRSVLSKPHCQLLMSFLKLQCDVILSGSENNERSRQIQHYLKYVKMKGEEKISLFDEFSANFINVLQYPMQPLQSNLDSEAYKVFELDSLKYEKYRQAVYTALLDLVSFEEKYDRVVNIFVVGAGRGPLVTASLMAGKSADRKIKVYAVEKNPNAVSALRYLNQFEWNLQVEIVPVDVRKWTFPVKADIILSELLGSFGDNELSPECLCGLEHYLSENGVMIPQSYTSYLTPIMSHKFHSDLLQNSDKNVFHMMYVVRMINLYCIDSPQAVWKFEHPAQTPLTSRMNSLTFDVRYSAVLHGFQCNFATNLYKDVDLSIVPETYTSGLYSWFSGLFPLETPVEVKSGQKIKLTMWRKITDIKVWYEWLLNEPTNSAIHNRNGFADSMSLI